MRQPKIIVVGGGLAGLMATIRIAEAGVPVDLFSIVPVKRSHSVCAQGGINAAKNQKGEGDTTWKHFDDTIYGGDFLANQPLVNVEGHGASGASAGEQRHWLESYYPVRVHGTITGIGVIVVEVTEQRRVAAQLQQSQAHRA